MDKHFHELKLRIGHYSSGDGLVGFVFDRTGPKPKYRLDGTSDVVVLEPKGSSSNGSTDLAVPGYGVVIRIGAYGPVTYFRGPRAEAVPMARDADADPLP